ncbi:MAG: hypothetical protein V2J55_04805 [Candidatus Competibacteraceae bacterium]|jgi:hypothetical protein|nr:hypothetical protein [Candidatus Competibacteraceae bacterium]
MNTIASMWRELVHSTSQQEEQRVIEKVQQYIFEKNITIQVTAVDSQGNEMGLNSLSEDDNVLVKVVFDYNHGSFEAPGWKPRSIDNVFILFQE